MDPKKFRSQILKHNTKENNRIPLTDLNSYLKSLYEFPNAMETIPIILTKEEMFSLDDIEFEVKPLSNGKYKDIKGYQAEIFKIGGPILIPHIDKLFNLVVKKGFWRSLTLAVQPLAPGSSLIFCPKSVNAPLIPHREFFYLQYSCNDLP